MISQISIRNFRSIAAGDFAASPLTTFVGANDAGKSNVLRALNLFFNGETNPGEAFDFKRDYNQFAEARARKAAEVEIRIRFVLPKSYQREGLPSDVDWKKVWRQEGVVQRLESRTFSNSSVIPPRSKIPALLDRVRFTSVPAIKDKAFFADLQGRLYDVLASTAEGPLKQSAGAFQAQLGAQLQGLLVTLQNTFGAEATMQLPENLREIFENLEISSGEIPLSRRGDGIKIRHIPMMLKFIAEKRDELLTRGGVRYTHVWGFEEPENNVEMSSAFEMASEFVDLVKDAGQFQLFVTTHSPIFYRLDQHRPEAADRLVSHFVSKVGNETSVETRSSDAVDETMGLMPIVAPYIATAKARYDEMKAQLQNVKDIAEQRRPTVFVEGDSDQLVIAKAWELFSGCSPEVINVTSGGDAYGGVNALQSRALAWMLTMRHRAMADRVKAACVFDRDPDGNRARAALGDEIKRFNLNTLGLKVIGLKMPPRLVALKQQGFLVSADLESYYSDKFWHHSRKAGWLKPVSDLGGRLSAGLVSGLAAGGPNPFDNLAADDALRVKFRFTDEGKRLASKKMVGLNSSAAVSELAEFRNLIEDIRSHFGLTP